MNERGVAYIPADRHRFGLVLSFPIADNLVLTSYYRRPFAHGLVRDEDAIDASAAKSVAEFDIRTQSVDALASTLSGGNQQKVVVAREFGRDLRLLILDQPTRGLDVGSIEFIHRQVIAKRNAGTAILRRIGRARRGPRDVRSHRGHVPRRHRGRHGRQDRREEHRRAAHGDRHREAGRRDRADYGVTDPTGGGPTPNRQTLVPIIRAAARGAWAVAALPMISIILALVVGAIVILASQLLLADRKFDPFLPITAYSALLEGSFGTPGAILNSLASSTAPRPRGSRGGARIQSRPLTTSGPRASS